MSGSSYRVSVVESAPFAENSYILWRDGSTDALVVDPGFEPDAILAELATHGLTVVAILNTHGHSDHIAGNEAMKQAFPDAPLLIGRNDAPLLLDPRANLSGLFGEALISPPADRLLDEGDVLELAGFQFEIREIPGHSPGSVVFVGQGHEPAFVIGGDVLFAGSVGRTDFPGGDPRTLFSGIRAKLFPLPDATIVLPGHGPPTTIGAERVSNPFVGENPGTYRLD
jgi:glyoxylase-like metal-dependent hydrolase (beta-lactamase superfamily II)